MIDGNTILKTIQMYGAKLKTLKIKRKNETPESQGSKVDFSLIFMIISYISQEGN